MPLAFDPTQPGAVRLRQWGDKLRRDFAPEEIEARERIWLADEECILSPGERATVPARTAERLVALGQAVRT